MKSKIMLLCAFFTCSCISEKMPSPDLSVVIKGEVLGTKSSCSISENSVVDMNVYAYSSGKLFFEKYGKGNSLTINLDKGRNYKLYVLANVGKISAPYMESELSQVRYEMNSYKGGAIPMVCKDGMVFTSDKYEKEVKIKLSRLFSKCSLRLERKLENCMVSFQSVKVMQQSSSIAPFSDDSAAITVQDGDSASDSDIEALNKGESVVFYIPENCQGVLLPDNEDPWLKTPSSIPQKASLCTYLDLVGRWTTSGAGADFNVRLYLGKDDRTDFNVERNTHLIIDLSITDSGTLRTSWKVEMDNLNDERRLAFDRYYDTIMQEEGWKEIDLEVWPEGMNYTAEILNESTKGSFECKSENGKVYVRGNYSGDVEQSAVLRVTSWDGMQRDSIFLSLDYTRSAFTAYSGQVPKCKGEWGKLVLDENQEHPVKLVFSGSTFFMDESKSSNVQLFQDPESASLFYLFPKTRTLYIYRPEYGGKLNFKIVSYKSEVCFDEDVAYYPSIVMNDGVISEGGCLQRTDSGIYYDSWIKAQYAYQDGKTFPVSNFRVPDEVLEYSGKSVSPEEAYYEYDSLYGYATFTFPAGDRAFVGQSLIVNTERFAYYDKTGLLWDAKLYGLKDLVQDAEYDLNLKLTVAPLTAVSKVRCIKAFPDQRYIGEIFNYQVAPGDLRKMTSVVDFTSSGSFDAPSEHLVEWSIRHSTASLDSSLEEAYSAGTVSDYSNAASMSGHSLSFEAMSSNRFPSCGSMVIKGTLRNPHTARTYTGYYRFDLVLFLSIGCQFDFVMPSNPYKMGFSFVPFCEYSTKSLASVWNEHLPDFFLIRSAYKKSSFVLKLPTSTTDNQWYETGADCQPNPILQNMMLRLSDKKEMFEFVFSQFFSEGPEMLCTREGYLNYPDPQMKAYADGRMGYYHMYRQYDLANIPAIAYNNGLDNYLIEAAYGSMSIY